MSRTILSAGLEGGKELETLLDSLANDLTRKNIFEKSARAGAEVIKDEANRMAPAPHIETELEFSSWNGARYMIGIAKDHWYMRFFETGAAPHEIPRKNNSGFVIFDGDDGLMVRSRVYHPGIQARPFMRPAFDNKKENAVRAVADVFNSEIDRIAQR